MFNETATWPYQAMFGLEATENLTTRLFFAGCHVITDTFKHVLASNYDQTIIEVTNKLKEQFGLLRHTMGRVSNSSKI
jgi:hypothetical protein